LFNVRTVNATFDDTLNQVDWFDDDGQRPENGYAGYGKWESPASAEANTARFIRALPQFLACGILAVNLCVQGGHPLNGKPWIEEGHGSAGRRPNGHRDFYHASGFEADGSLDPDHWRRIADIIEAWKSSGKDILFRGAPHLLITSSSNENAAPLHDCIIALTTFETYAQSCSVGTLWNGLAMLTLSELLPELKTRLGIPENHQIGYVMGFGYPALKYQRTIERGGPQINRVVKI
jgi:hypothetical protein